MWGKLWNKTGNHEPEYPFFFNGRDFKKGCYNFQNDYNCLNLVTLIKSEQEI